MCAIWRSLGKTFSLIVLAAGHACMCGDIRIVGSLAMEGFLFDFDGLHRCTTQLLLEESTIDLLHHIPP